MLKKEINPLARRLAPLYCAAFFQGFVFWYAFEKIFIKSIGFTDTDIGVMIAVYSFVMLVVETPSGLLADRWSRKGVLVLASCFLAAASLFGGLSQNVIQYICAGMFWGAFFAMYSGTYDSIVYDTLYEETGSSRGFDKYYGRIKSIDSIALVISSIIGAVLANIFSFRAGYFLTIPFALLSILFLLKFREPKLHKQEVFIPIKQQISSTFRAVTRNSDVFIVVLSLVTLNLLLYITLEFSQLWYIALAAPVALYGFFNALLLTSFGIGGYIVSTWRLYRFHLVVFSLVLAVLSSLGLVYGRSLYIIVPSLVLLATVLISFTVIFNRVLHDSLSSNIRAGASSTISTLGRLLIIPTAVFVGYLSKNYTIFNAAWVLVLLVTALSVFVLLEARKDNRTALTPK